ncbi:hypothetical protein [Roseivirga echinicomitans]|uniref:Uncharacterized protein n=1 Tax=Roseivirga echinicomitans TaxID=296218 RepID=A0A150XUC7_9BACT|nr:hypothetical protein [Roseivirga echinicomitans]KYG82284.1 hypothetical protein AWN68_15705 [Roseivirga echinicomitans]
MKKSILLSLLAILLVFVIAQKSIPLTFKLNEVYKDKSVNVPEVIKNFSALLVQKGILITADLSKPDLIYDKLSALENVSPAEFGIDKYVDAKTIKNWKAQQKILDASIDDQANIALFTYYQLFSEEYTKIKLHIKANRTVDFKGEHLPMASFDTVLFDEINRLKDKGVEPSQVTMELQVDPITQFEFTTFIQDKLRKLEIRKVTLLSNK